MQIDYDILSHWCICFFLHLIFSLQFIKNRNMNFKITFSVLSFSKLYRIVYINMAISLVIYLFCFFSYNVRLILSNFKHEMKLSNKFEVGVSHYPQYFMSSPHHFNLEIRIYVDVLHNYPDTI